MEFYQDREKNRKSLVSGGGGEGSGGGVGSFEIFSVSISSESSNAPRITATSANRLKRKWVEFISQRN